MTDRAPIITLLTDFGVADAYVGVVKGVILSRCPAARIVDLSHEIDQGNMHAAAHVLAAAWPYFPAGTIHTAVVDPGVGSGRRILAARINDQTFIAPDNGLLSAVFDAAAPQRVISVENDEHFLKPVSQTFHGRDIFAPVAAALANGAPLDDLGPAVDSWIHLPRSQPARDSGGELVGEVVYIDRFGNLVTNFAADELPDEPLIHIAKHIIRGLSRSYAEVDDGELLAIIGSTNRLEISASSDNAAEILGLSIGAEVRVTNG